MKRKYTFILKYEDKNIKFNRVYERQNYIIKNNIQKGICQTFLDDKRVSGYSFSR